MFTIKQPDNFALETADAINSTAEAMLAFMVSSVKSGFRTLFYQGDAVRPKADIRRILETFETPAELFTRHLETVEFLLAQQPGCLAEEDYVVPVAYTLNNDGSVTIPD